MNNEPLQYFYLAQRRRRERMQDRLKRFAFGVVYALLAAAMVVGFTLLFVNAIERELDWRADRLCSIYGVCDPKAGP